MYTLKFACDAVTSIILCYPLNGLASAWEMHTWVGVILHDHTHLLGGLVIKGSTLTADDHSLVRTPFSSSAATLQLNSKLIKRMTTEYAFSVSGRGVIGSVLAERRRTELFLPL